MFLQRYLSFFIANHDFVMNLHRAQSSLLTYFANGAYHVMLFGGVRGGR